jgi:hypothetical protein
MRAHRDLAHALAHILDATETTRLALGSAVDLADESDSG